MAMRVASNKEGNGKGGKGDGNSNMSVRRGMATVTKRATGTALRVAGSKEGDGNKEGNGDSNEGSG